MIGRDEVLEVLIGRVRAVMALDDLPLGPDTRFDEDLHADSLDIVEIVEAVERDLRGRGVEVALPDEELVSVTTLSDAAERIGRHVTGVAQ